MTRFLALKPWSFMSGSSALNISPKSLSKDGKALPPICVKGNFNSTQYRYLLAHKVFPALDRTYGRGRWVWQQDGAPCHTSEAIQKYLVGRLGSRGFWPKDFWPPSSPNLNPLDYHVWTRVEEKACSRPHSNIIDLKKSVDAAWNSMNMEDLRTACGAFRRRLEACIAAEGSIFEK